MNDNSDSAIEQRLAIISAYHDEVTRLLVQKDIRRALQTLFDMIHDIAPIFEHYLVVISKKTLGTSSRSAEISSEIQVQLFGILDAIGRHGLNDLLMQPAAARSIGWGQSERLQSSTESMPFGGSLDDVREAVRRTVRGSAPPLVEVTEAGRKLGRGRRSFVISNISLVVEAGVVLGVVGFNGAGKTTLLRMIAGALRAKRGRIEYPGIAERCGSKRIGPIRQRIAFIGTTLEPVRERVDDFLAMTLAAQGLSVRSVVRKTTFALHRYGLAEFAEHRVSDLSSGYRLRFEIARVLMAEPILLVLDEPLAHLDPEAQRIVLEDLRAAASQVDQPVGIVLTSQHLREIETIADKMLVLRRGKPIYYGRTDEVSSILDQSLFRIRTNDDRQLQTALASIKGLRLRTSGTETTILAPPITNAARLLETVLGAGLEIRYFEDLSRTASAVLMLEDVFNPGSFGTSVAEQRDAR